MSDSGSACCATSDSCSSISARPPRARSPASASASAGRRRAWRAGCRCAMREFDVAIVGGGPVGACAAALLARGSGASSGGLSVALIEPHAPQPPAAGAWPAIAGVRACAYERMRIWHEAVAVDGEGVLTFDAADVGEPNLGYIVENRLLQTALITAFTAAGGQLEPAHFSSLEIEADAVRITTTRGELRAR